MDVVRILAAILLLGNIQFNDNQKMNIYDCSNIGLYDSKANNEIKAVASLLGVSAVALYRGLTIKTQNIRNQLIKSVSDKIGVRKQQQKTSILPILTYF